MMSIINRQKRRNAITTRFAILSVFLCGGGFLGGPHILEAAEVVAPHTTKPETPTQPAASPEVQPAVKTPERIAPCLGQTEAEVQQILGEPDGRVASAGRTVLIYSGESLNFINGKLINPKPDIFERIEANKAAADKKAAHEKVLAEKNKKMPSVKNSAALTANTANKVAGPVETPRKPAVAPGSQSAAGEYSGLIVPGKITVVDFYATWCGPCKRMAPLLDDMVRGKSDVTLRKVDIGDWGSSVAKKYNITSVPNVRVFDKQGRMIGSPASNPNQVAQNIEQARGSQ